MAFPTAPTDQETYNGYIYSATDGVWRKDVTSKDEMFPVGMSYIQFPGMYSPIDLGWPGTWENVSNQFAGDFFRAEGGNASAFGSGEQAEDFKSHSHSGSTNTTGSHSHSGSTNTTGSHSHGTNSSYGDQVSANTSVAWFRDTSHFMAGGVNSVTHHNRNTKSAGSHSHSLSINNNGNHSHTVTIDSNGGAETRPVNRTIRIWKRTA